MASCYLVPKHTREYCFVPKDLEESLIRFNLGSYLCEVRNTIVPLARKYDVRVRFFWDYPWDSADYYGSANLVTGTIILSSDLLCPGDLDLCLSIFFHEVGHIHCARNGLWKSYHDTNPKKENKTAARRTAVKAERWVDRWAAKELKKNFPGWSYVHHDGDLEYSKEDREYYRDAVEKIYQ